MESLNISANKEGVIYYKTVRSDLQVGSDLLISLEIAHQIFTESICLNSL